MEKHSEHPYHLRRVQRCQQEFERVFRTRPDGTIRSPGRAEIIGNHTDYNQGYAIAAAISRSILACFSPRNDKIVRLYSTTFPSDTPVAFTLGDDISQDPVFGWTDYVRGVAKMFFEKQPEMRGVDILFDSDLPASGGMSSSAANELAAAFAFNECNGVRYGRLQLAQLAQRAENEFVKSPCGFLDQGTIALAAEDHFVFLDFKASGSASVGEIASFRSALDKHLTFVIAVDPAVKRQLGQSGYPARRKSCEQSIAILSRLLDRELTSLRDVSVSEFERVRDQLQRLDSTIAKRVEHVVLENQRVLDAASALQRGEAAQFGRLLTASGKSSLDLYELDEKTPELRYLFEEGMKLDGVVGIRNMGGGFSAVVLALVKDSALESFESEMARRYRAEYGHGVEFIDFKPGAGVGVIG